MKNKTQYVCQSCGQSSPKWLGRCSMCGNWNTFVEERIASAKDARASLPLSSARKAGNRFESLTQESQNKELSSSRRFKTGLSDLDRVLGGGLVADSLCLLGGDPGIGKSTLLLQMASGLVQEQPELKVLYVSGEESMDQLRDRASRLELKGREGIYLASETELEEVFHTAGELGPDVLILDSLQTFRSNGLESAPGSVSQLRDVTMKVMTYAKTSGKAVWLVGHVTKDGNLAGPKVVEHMVDTVLYFEGENDFPYRLLRTMKNRFGSTRELGVFEMDHEGLKEVKNPSQLFLTERPVALEGVAIAGNLEGSRSLLVEVQALVVRSSFAVAKRTSVGLDAQRLSLIAAILERHMKLQLSENDLYFNVVGGIKLTEPACDLAVAAAIASSVYGQALPQGTLFVGELGLTGEVRRVGQVEARLKEAEKLGFKGAVIPKGSLKSKMSDFSLKIREVSVVSDLKSLFQPQTAKPKGAEHVLVAPYVE